MVAASFLLPSMEWIKKDKDKTLKGRLRKSTCHPHAIMETKSRNGNIVSKRLAAMQKLPCRVLWGPSGNMVEAKLDTFMLLSWQEITVQVAVQSTWPENPGDGASVSLKWSPRCLQWRYSKGDLKGDLYTDWAEPRDWRKEKGRVFSIPQAENFVGLQVKTRLRERWLTESMQTSYS